MASARAAARLLLQQVYGRPTLQGKCCSSSTAAFQQQLGSNSVKASTSGSGGRQLFLQAFKQGFSSAAQQAGPVVLQQQQRQKSPFRQLKALFRDYKKLSKFRLSALVALTASAGFAAGSGDSIDYAQLAWTSLGTLGAAACANTLNQLYEVANDGRMARTANRPLPAGRLSSRHAKVFALVTGAAGLWVLSDKVSRSSNSRQTHTGKG